MALLAGRPCWSCGDSAGTVRTSRLVAENLLRDLRVNSFGAVHDLSHDQIHGNAAQEDRGLVIEPLRFDEKVNHFGGSKSGGLVQIGIEAHCDVMGGRFGLRPPQRAVLVEKHLYLALERGFHRRTPNLTVVPTKNLVLIMYIRDY